MLFRSTKWWSELFYSADAKTALVVFAVIVIVSMVAARLLPRVVAGDARWLRFLGPIGFFLAFVVVGLMTSWYSSIFKFASIGDAMRTSFVAAFGATVIAVEPFRAALGA